MDPRRFYWTIVFVILVLLVIYFAPIGLRRYAVVQIEHAKRDGVYATPEDGMRDLIENNYGNIERVEIDHAGTNSFDGRSPHVWFVSARVYAAARGDGRKIDEGAYDYPGSYFLHTDEGWVHVPEGRLPVWVGRAMAWFELFGCDRDAGNCR